MMYVLRMSLVGFLVSLHVCLYLYVFICMSCLVCLYLCVYTYVSVLVCGSLCVSTYVSTYVCLAWYVCTCVVSLCACTCVLCLWCRLFFSAVQMNSVALYVPCAVCATDYHFG